MTGKKLSYQIVSKFKMSRLKRLSYNVNASEKVIYRIKSQTDEERTIQFLSWISNTILGKIKKFLNQTQIK